MPSQTVRIGGPLQRALADRLIGQKELALTLGVDQQTVSRWVRNESGPRLLMLKRIARELDVTPHDLVESDDEPVAA